MAAPSTRRGKPLILHVEDDQAQSETLKHVLERNGFAVLQADSVQEALHICQETPVSLVLADHMLSGSTGAGLARQIKAIKPALPVVMHSGSPPTTMRHLDGFIYKGEPARTLVAFIRDLVDRFWE